VSRGDKVQVVYTYFERNIENLRAEEVTVLKDIGFLKFSLFYSIEVLL
jgi:hypothetical protein